MSTPTATISFPSSAALRPDLAGLIVAIGLVCSAPFLLSLFGRSLTTHMGIHILLMNAAAPLVAFSAVTFEFTPIRPGARGLVFATVLQIMVLWGWHAPSVLERALNDAPLHLIMQLSLFVAASSFWFAALSQRKADLWRAILALLVTSKLYCLLAVLLIFAPVSLYSGTDVAHRHALGTLADQQMAGLLMLLACPLTYFLVGIIMAAQWLRQLTKADRLGWAPAAKSPAADQGS